MASGGKESMDGDVGSEVPKKRLFWIQDEKRNITSLERYSRSSERQDADDWDEEKISYLFNASSAEAIKKILWPSVICQDKLIWIGNKTGQFSVRDCYLAGFNTSREEEGDDFWDKLWKAKIHERLKVFLWRLVSGALPLNQVIYGKTRKGFPFCPCCGIEEESVLHRFKGCETTKRDMEYLINLASKCTHQAAPFALLEKLEIKYMDNLKGLCHPELLHLQRDPTTQFQLFYNLTSVDLSDCHKVRSTVARDDGVVLHHLSTLETFVRAATMSAKDSPMLEHVLVDNKEIFDYKGPGDLNTTIHQNFQLQQENLSEGPYEEESGRDANKDSHSKKARAKHFWNVWHVTIVLNAAGGLALNQLHFTFLFCLSDGIKLDINMFSSVMLHRILSNCNSLFVINLNDSSASFKMGSDRKSEKKKIRKRSSLSSSEDEGRIKRKRIVEDEERKSRSGKKEKPKDKESSSKHSKRNTHKEGISGIRKIKYVLAFLAFFDKITYVEAFQGFIEDSCLFNVVAFNYEIQELSNDDYFSKSNEFATWLKEEKDVFFSDLSSESAREMFSGFVKAWNNHTLESRYYEGIASGPRSAHKWKIKA
ncbi:hypothetical protein FNV43_RR19691 [Rhamnella rubrinervis]|uniref:Reverse transcriptase zinc-binding domain-containing protein n=1 Tax=Rhamnella rubrinervis TaxID=2594499 RepID=A0A8K0DZ06_9ROSA|nr:hypothetical protein FNV43_RR19691 [Rhamnella rubrinervis]